MRSAHRGGIPLLWRQPKEGGIPLSYRQPTRLQPEQVLYFNTDSIIFSHRPGQPMLPLGDHLGEFTSELKPDDHTIISSNSLPLAPRITGTEPIKVKSNARYAGSPSTRAGKLNWITKPSNKTSSTKSRNPKTSRVILVHNPHKIKRDANTKTLETAEETKRYRVVFDKRVVDPDTFQSYPYGYIRAEFEDVGMENIDILMGL